MDYNFQEVEKKWQKYWQENNTFCVKIDKSKKKYYVLDMFPYPSGAGLHVGHPLGYIASDIYSRYQRLNNYNVLHPMGYDAYGLPAEQYAIQTGQHPALTTKNNIERYRKQLDELGLSFDWSKQVITSDPKYYKWTQWTFIQLFNSYYCYDENKAKNIDSLIYALENGQAKNLNVACSEKMDISKEEWANFTDKQRSDVLMNYRLAYLSDAIVNWCPDLGTVLANDEVVGGLSVRGGFPVERKNMQQWSLRITAYAQRLLEGLDKLDWSDSIKEIQRNWIGQSKGATLFFPLSNGKNLEVFTTRADTIYGVTFMVLSPEHPLIEELTTQENKKQVQEYVIWAKNRSERERLMEVKHVSGVFLGSYATNPLSNESIPIWVSDYVLSGYGSGAIMAVPAHDSRDFAFAKHFSLPIKQVVVPNNEKEEDTTLWKDSKDSKQGTIINSDFLNGLDVKNAIDKAIDYIEKNNIGYSKTNYRLRDAIFSRQRYWGEPFPIYYKDDIPFALPEERLPLELPDIDVYLPTKDGLPPIARAKNWCIEIGGKKFPLDYNTMPGFAGSNAYFFRYMDPNNNEEFFSQEAIEYWQDVDLYVGGSEHATGHLLYSRFITKFLYDISLSIKDEPYKKLINQGMIQGRSNFVYRIVGTNKFVSYNLKDNYEVSPLHVDINIVDNDVLDIEKFRLWREEFKDAEFILENNGSYICGYEIEKMSKSLFNVQNPDELILRYGADTLRLYEMFLGPIEQSKPWDTKGIEGVFRFIRKFWKLFHDNDNNFSVEDDEPLQEEYKILYRTIKKVRDDIERFSFNTAVSSFMICVNSLTELKCKKKKILEPLTILLSPFAPHISEELWSLMGHNKTISFEAFPLIDETFLVEEAFTYPVSVNGKLRTTMPFPINEDEEKIKQDAISNTDIQKYIEGKTIKKIIFVRNKIINIVC
ncbi:MAG: leucine--tRNA ligase [Bacteroidales bacterium]|jgi:leucyl-tRNA synthetase|nr:leucine--tRNA ligase [Bacteroidales bacterium]